MKQKPKKALKDFNNGILLLPNEKSLLVFRGMARYELGDKEGAMSYWTRVRNLGGVESEVYIEIYPLNSVFYVKILLKLLNFRSIVLQNP